MPRKKTTRRRSSIANSDTPDIVNVPPGLMGLVVWAAGRFGVGVAGMIVFGFALKVMYGNWREDSVRHEQREQATTDANLAIAKNMVEQFAQRTIIEQKHVETLERLTGSNKDMGKSLEDLREEARRAHQLYPKATGSNP